MFAILLLPCIIFSDVVETYETRSTFSVGFSYGSFTSNDSGRYGYEFKNNLAFPSFTYLKPIKKIDNVQLSLGFGINGVRTQMRYKYSGFDYVEYGNWYAESDGLFRIILNGTYPLKMIDASFSIFTLPLAFVSGINYKINSKISLNLQYYMKRQNDDSYGASGVLFDISYRFLKLRSKPGVPSGFEDF